MVFFANAADGLISGQEMIRGQSALRHTGLLGTPIFNVKNACASAASASLLSCMAVESGATDVAMAVGAGKHTHSDKARPLAGIGTAIDLSLPPTLDGRIAGDEQPTGPMKRGPVLHRGVGPLSGRATRRWPSIGLLAAPGVGTRMRLASSTTAAAGSGPDRHAALRVVGGRRVEELAGEGGQEFAHRL